MTKKTKQFLISMLFMYGVFVLKDTKIKFKINNKNNQTHSGMNEAKIKSSTLYVNKIRLFLRLSNPIYLHPIFLFSFQ